MRPDAWAERPPLTVQTAYGKAARTGNRRGVSVARRLATTWRALRNAASTAIADQAQREALGPGIVFGAGVVIRGADRITVGSGTFIDTRAYVSSSTVNSRSGYVRIGRRCEIGPYSVLWGGGGIEIGDNVHLGAHVHITSQQGRPVRPGRESDPLEIECLPVRIGSCVLVYSGAIIVPGVTIGHHSVIGAGAVVTSDLEPYSFAAGVPARVISRTTPTAVFS
jgi:acetyltransferase-like isoleucine patch superfamily enzyme